MRSPLASPKANAICERVITGHSLPTHVSTDYDPLFRFHRCLTNLRVVEIEEIKSVPG